MEYKLASAFQKGMPFEKQTDPNKKNSKKIFGINVTVRTRIINQVYIGFENLDNVFCPIEKTDDSSTVLLKIEEFAKSFISEKYPNT